jgi:formate dehydrogenase (NADP+) beta subunit
VDVCPTECLKLVALCDIAPTPDVDGLIGRTVGTEADRTAHSAILKDEDRCIRCALCVMRCPTEAIVMERVAFSSCWRVS